MEHHDTKRLPLGVLYGLLGLLFAWAAAYRLPMTRDLFTHVFRPREVIATPFMVDWPDGVIQFTATDLDEHAAPPLRRGDRVVSIDGRPFRTGGEVLRRAAALGPQGTMLVFVAADSFSAGAVQHDDMTVVVVRMNA